MQKSFREVSKSQSIRKLKIDIKSSNFETLLLTKILFLEVISELFISRKEICNAKFRDLRNLLQNHYAYHAP
jgi:hypothetical protein